MQPFFADNFVIELTAGLSSSTAAIQHFSEQVCAAFGVFVDEVTWITQRIRRMLDEDTPKLDRAGRKLGTYQPRIAGWFRRAQYSAAPPPFVTAMTRPQRARAPP